MKQAILWITAAAAFLAFSAMVWADTRNIGGGSFVTLQDTSEPNAIAEVEFTNRAVNGAQDNGEFTLTHGALEITVTFTWNSFGDHDMITVQVPPGYVADPDVLEVPEGETMTLYIRNFELLGV